jgi:AraC family transcriptional regulator
MNRLKHLVRSPQISVLRFDHQPDAIHHDPKEETCEQYAINFVESGSFELFTQKTNWPLFSGSVFISRPGAVHRYLHREPIPSDCCISVSYSRTFVEEAKRADHLVLADAPPAIPPTNRLGFLKFRLAQLTREADPLALESWGCELIAAVSLNGRRPGRLYRSRQLRWYSERVETVRQLLDTCYAESHSLFSLARSVGMSPFQFARIFSELAGLPPHRYLLRVRLNQASKMILDGKPVTETCFDVGFSNLSHFTRSFNRRFGCAPSLYKLQPPKKAQESASR